MDTTDMALQGATVPQASYHIEVSSVGDIATAVAEPVKSEPMAPPPASAGGPRSVVLVRSGADPAADGGRSVKYVLTGLPAAGTGTAVGVTPVKSPAVATTGQAKSASRARQILKKRLDLSVAEKKYTRMLHPELAAAETDGSGEPPSASTSVMICEPEAASAKKKGRTFFFVAKPPGEDVEEGQVAPEPGAETPRLPNDPDPSGRAVDANMGVLKRLARYKLSEKYEILPAASFEDAEEIMHRLRLQNLMLKTEMVRQATEYEQHGDEHGLRGRPGRRRPTTIVAVDRLRELEKIEAGMHTLFTPSQVKTLSRDYKKNSVQWRDEDFRRALGLLEHSSQSTFNYVRKVMNIPLPSIGTLKLRCPNQPELHVRLEAALQERGGGDGPCKQCARRANAAAAAAARDAAGDGAEQGDYPHMPALAADEQQVQWAAQAASPAILSRKRARAGGVSPRKVIRQDEDVVFYEAPVAPPSRARARRSGSSGGGGETGRRGRLGLVTHHQPSPPPPPPDDEEEDDDDEEPEDDDDFEEEFGEDDEDEETVEIDPQQQEVPAHFSHFRNTYDSSGWNEWDPRQLQ